MPNVMLVQFKFYDAAIVRQHCVLLCSAVRIYLPTDLRPLCNRATVGKSLLEVQRRFPDGLPLLDPVQDMKIPITADGSSGETGIRSKDSTLTGYGSLVERIGRLQSRMVANSVHSSPERDKKHVLADIFQS